MTWLDLPERVRLGVEEILSAPVAEASSQAGGFSPGTADRIRTADGHRAFVKAVSRAQNEQTVGLHRREAKVAAQLPANPRIPAFLGSYDDGEWVALVLEDIDGRHPATPWLEHELHSVLTSLTALASELTPSPVGDLPTAKEILADDFAGWTRVLADPPPDLDPWAHRNIHQLLNLADRGLDVLAGDTLVHTDTRADNLLIRPNGTVVVLDWPWACVGAAWLDILLLLEVDDVVKQALIVRDGPATEGPAAPAGTSSRGRAATSPSSRAPSQTRSDYRSGPTRPGTRCPRRRSNPGRAPHTATGSR